MPTFSTFASIPFSKERIDVYMSSDMNNKDHFKIKLGYLA